MSSKSARIDLEKKLGKSVISNENVLDYQYIEDRIPIEEDSKTPKE